MKLSKKHIFIIVGIILILFIVAWILIGRRSKSKGIKDIQSKTDEITSVSSANNPATPSMYGVQNVIQGSDGIWRLAPGTCSLVTTGIIDWATIKSMSDAQQDQLYQDIENCNAQSLPLLQP